MSVLYSVAEVEVQNQTTTTGTPFVYAENTLNNWEWGKVCTGTIQVPNFPILKFDAPFPNTSLLQISTFKGQYQLYWNDGNEDEAVIMLQCLTTETPYPKNQKALDTISIKTPSKFKLVIDLASEDLFGGISLVDMSSN
ncbi:hypothetical protein [Sediminitomix flava]|uniref:Uncharacterized protein n=1 Tax=Sediminitomix flava TaxID=379075 RepID=A0A315Z6K8_SEDFL|nr:hypothetical protein [Sediminitomix flava]PWJ38001.1 hypothetical protein BC781_108136 [Sediminitomix flava]